MDKNLLHLRRYCGCSDIFSRLPLFHFGTALREGVTTPWVAFRMVKLWKSLLQKENGQNKIALFHISALHPQSYKGLQEGQGT